MGAPSIQSRNNLVELTLSGDYESSRPILLDAANPLRSISRPRAEELISSLAGAFEADTTVCLHLGNDVTYPILVLSILASKCRWTGTNPAYTAHELNHHFSVSQTKYVVVDHEHFDTVRTAVEGLKANIEIILFDDILAVQMSELSTKRFNAATASAPRTLMDLMQRPDKFRLRKLLEDVKPDDTAALMSTSGTTGLPKMAARTHEAMMAELLAIEDNHAAKLYEVRRLLSTPIFHAFSTPEMVFNPLRVGYPTYILKRTDSTFAQKVHDFGITETAAAPPVLKKFVKEADNHHLLQNLKLVLCGGAALPPAERTQFLDIFKQPPRLIQVWGMTEGGWFTTFKYSEDDATGSVGRPIPGYQVKVAPTEGVRLEGDRGAGELLIKGPQLMSHYYGNATATEKTFTADGWLKTGDIGYLEGGKVYIVDRIKDLIKVNGFQVSPAEIEEGLAQSPLVIDAGVCAAGHGTEEHPALFVVRKDKGVTDADVKECLSGRLTSYKVKYNEVFFVDLVPKSATGKILRNELKKMVEKIERERSECAVL